MGNNNNNNSFSKNTFGSTIRPPLGIFGTNQHQIDAQILNSKFCATTTNNLELCYPLEDKENIRKKKIIEDRNLQIVLLLSNKNYNNNNNSDVLLISDSDQDDLSKSVDAINSFYDEIEVLMSEIGIPRSNDGIYNLSKYTLSDSEIGLLNKGLKFCPTPPLPDIGLLVRDTERFFRSAAIKLYFQNLSQKDKTDTSISDPDQYSQSANNITSPPTEAYSHPDLKPKSKWNAPVPPS